MREEREKRSRIQGRMEGRGGRRDQKMRMNIDRWVNILEGWFNRETMQLQVSMERWARLLTGKRKRKEGMEWMDKRLNWVERRVGEKSALPLRRREEAIGWRAIVSKSITYSNRSEFIDFSTMSKIADIEANQSFGMDDSLIGNGKW